LATLSATGGKDVISWTISGLQSPFTPANYVAAGIALSPAASGSSTPPSGILDSVSSYSAGGYSVSGICSAPAGTYTVYGWTLTPSALVYWPAGSATVTVTSDTIQKFYWANVQTEPISAGHPVVIRASAWNSMVSKIEEIKGSSLSSLKVSAGNILTASLYNSVVNQLKSINSVVSLSTVSKGQTLLAAHLIALQTAINYLIDNF